MNDLEFARELTASIFTAFVLAMKNARLSNEQIKKITEHATVLTKTIISDPNIPVSPQAGS